MDTPDVCENSGPNSLLATSTDKLGDGEVDAGTELDITIANPEASTPNSPNPRPKKIKTPPASRDASSKLQKVRPKPHHLPLSVASGPDFVLINDNRISNPPIVIQKKNGRPGAFVPYNKDLHNNFNLPGDFDFSLTPSGSSDPNNVWIPAICILGIISLAGVSYLIVVTGKENVGSIEGKLIYQLKETRFISFKTISSTYTVEEYSLPFVHIKEWIDSEVFYFSFKYHLTHSLQYQFEHQADLASKPLWRASDRRYFWNYHLQRHFIRHRLDNLITPVIRGFVRVSGPFRLDNQGKVELHIGLISRINCRRAGTRYNTRGINDDGNVANFVATEQIIFMEGHVCSWVQLRGSVPIFWEQRPKGVVSQVVPATLTRTPEATAIAFGKHFDELVKHYGRIAPVNLLSIKKEGEAPISKAYQEQINRYPGQDAVHYIQWDMHHHCGQTNYQNTVRLIPLIEGDVKKFGFFLRNSKGDLLSRQTGALRINCMDCLDRTNVIQNLAGQMSFVGQLGYILGNRMSGQVPVPLKRSSQVGSAINTLWADNGDNLSKAYTGTGAIKSDYTRTGGKRTIGGMFEDVGKSLTRLYINNFKDTEKQEAIDLFLGLIEEELEENEQSQEEKWIAAQTRHHAQYFTTTDHHKMFIGTWSVNGSKAMSNLDAWISPDYDVDHQSVSIYVFGFQELGDDPDVAVEQWDSTLKEQINAKRTTKVILAGYGIVNGVAVLVFVAENEMPNIRQFSIQKDSLTLSGHANFVAVRFDFYQSSICCVCCVLTAGPFEATERINEIHTITSETHFDEVHHTPTIEDHDYQFWCGSMNFSIDLPYNEVLARIGNTDIDMLLLNDQLNKARRAGLLWKNHNEGKIKFLPTFKYAIGTDQYDTVDKTIAPCWPDRILYNGRQDDLHNIQCIAYSQAKLYNSDHRPIKGLYDLKVNHIKKSAKNQVTEELLKISHHLAPQELLSLEKYPLTIANITDSPAPERQVIKTPRTPDKPAEPPNQFTNTQKSIMEYCLSLVAINDKLEAANGDVETIMAATNLVAGTIKALLQMLSNFSTNDHAKALTQNLIQLVVTLGIKAKALVGNPTQDAHKELVGVIADMTVTINLFVPNIT